jgi:PPOX class probable F420-dependent enzyme
MSQFHSDRVTDPSIRRLFEGKNFAFVSTLMSNGYPHTTPTWVDIEDGNILINTAIGRIKHKNVSKDPRLSLAVVDHNNPYDMVAVRGKVIEQIKGDAAEKHIDKLSKKYLGKDEYPNRRAEEQRVILKVKPEKIFHMK